MVSVCSFPGKALCWAENPILRKSPRISFILPFIEIAYPPSPDVSSLFLHIVYMLPYQQNEVVRLRPNSQKLVGSKFF